MKYVIVGGVAGGAGTAARLRRLEEDAQILMLEQGPYVSYSNCSLPYRLSGTVDQTEKLVLMDPGKFAAQYNIQARVNSRVTALHRERKAVTVRDLESGREYEERYDKLVLATGAQAVFPPIPGLQEAQVFPVKTVPDIDRLHQALEGGAKRVTVVGGGFIGVEVAVNLREAGHQVALVEAAPQILSTYDYDMVQILHKELLDHGVDLRVGDPAASFQGCDLTLASGAVLEGDLVVMAAGVRPDTALAREAGLALNSRGAIVVDPSGRTSDPSIYAVGDAVQVYHALTGKPLQLPLAGPAQKQARQAADSICGRPVENTGYIGSSCIRVFDLNAASTGLTAAQCQREGIPYDIAYVIPQDRVGLMPGSAPLHYKLVFQVPTGKVLGVQAISKGDAPKRVDIAATLIKFGGTVYDLRDLELCYAPPFSNPKDAGNQAGLVACNLLEGAFRQVRVQEVRGAGGSGGLHHRRAGGGGVRPLPHQNRGEHPLKPAAPPPGGDPPGPAGVPPLPQRPAQLQRLPLPAGPRLFQRVQHLRQLFGAVPVRVLQRRDPGPRAHCHWV